MSRPERAASPRSRRLDLALRLGLVLGAVFVVSPGATPATAQADDVFRLYTDLPGVYAVRFEELGLAGGDLASSDLALSNRGEPVSIWLEDGGDGRFGPGDRIEFVAERLPGTQSHHHEYSPFNVYWLRVAAGGGARMRPALPPVSLGSAPGWRRSVHLERDLLLIRLGAEDLGEAVEPELWFWHKLTHVDRERFEIPLDLPGLAGAGGAEVEMTLHLRALSSQPDEDRSELPDHQVDVALASRRLDSPVWDGKAGHRVELAPVPARYFQRDGQSLSLSVPRRKPQGPEPQGQTDPLVDVVMLNWIEIDYPHDGSVGAEQVELRAAGDRPAVSLGEGGAVAYGASGTRAVLPPAAGPQAIAGPPESSYWLVPEGGLYSAAGIERDRPSTLRDPARRADYLILAHATLLDEARRLADFHRARGLAVELVDVQDVYDEFGHGIVHPRAVKDFVTWAWKRWAPPAPRYVLLVGDASWDTKNVEADDARYANWVDRQLLAPGGFRAKEIAPYDDGLTAGDRNLIPTWNYTTREGHAASDNWFVAVEGDDVVPELAIGRFPLATPEELAGVIDKTIRYAAHPPVGPWRRRILWITNEWEWLQEHSIAIDDELRGTGLAGRRIFPTSDETTNEHHQAQLTDAFNAGQLLVHFAGHGGRFIWRTAPRDLGRKNHDLFTLEHVEALEPNDRLPVVFSVTCHSGPFDHPSADSIAERFLRLPDRGAIAVISAAWRTSAASVRLSRAMMLEFAEGGTIGDAFLRAKRRLDLDDLIATYNLFGDPAAPLTLPAGRVELRLEGEADARRLVGTLDAPAFQGEAIVDLLDADGTVLASERFTVDSPRWEMELPATPSEAWVRAYAWSEEDAVDALGALDLRPPQEP